MNWLHEPGIRSLIDIKPDDLSSIPKVHIVEESQIPHAIVWSLYMLVSCACVSVHTHTHAHVHIETHMHSCAHTHTHTH